MAKNTATVNLHITDPELIGVSSMTVNHSLGGATTYIRIEGVGGTILATREAATALAEQIMAHVQSEQVEA